MENWAKWMATSILFYSMATSSQNFTATGIIIITGKQLVVQSDFKCLPGHDALYPPQSPHRSPKSARPSVNEYCRAKPRGWSRLSWQIRHIEAPNFGRSPQATYQTLGLHGEVYAKFVLCLLGRVPAQRQYPLNLRKQATSGHCNAIENVIHLTAISIKIDHLEEKWKSK